MSIAAEKSKSSKAGVLPLKYEQGKLLMLDQRRLPHELVYFDATTLDAMCFAIEDMVVRGAPSIGVAAAYGYALEAMRLEERLDQKDALEAALLSVRDRLDATRPTAVNLHWALMRMWQRSIELLGSGLLKPGKELLSCADEIFNEHIESNRALSEFGAGLVPQKAAIITHCNAGPLAACGWGTALGVIRFAHFAGKEVSVFVDETRPRNQGSKLTMWELHQDQVPCTLVCDSMSGHLMQHNKVDMVITGADRIARNGDSANKIGTYNLAVLAHHHRIPFYIAAPLSTFDPGLMDGSGIPIEERNQNEVLTIDGAPLTVAGGKAFNPAFDVTPAALIAGIITEKGVLLPDFKVSISKALGL